MLDVRSLCAWYGQSQALWSIDLHAEEGEIVGVLGRNGAGKTTLLGAIAGLMSKTAGEVLLEGRPVRGLAPAMRARSGISMVREAGRMAASLTVAQNIDLGRRLAQLRAKEPPATADIWKWFPLLEPLSQRRSALLSGGQRQALALAIAFASRPRLLLLDEPSAGLAPPVAHELFETIRRLAASGLTVLLVEQQASWLDGLSSRNYLIEVGRISQPTSSNQRQEQA